MSIAIMGFGNPVRSDDGVGCYVLENLKKELSDRGNVSFFDMGTSAFEILFQLKGHHKIIIIDAVINSNEADGTIFRLPASEIHASIIDDPMVFLHSLKWNQALSYAKKIMQDDFPQNDIHAYLIAVSEIKMEIGLSPSVLEAANKVIDHIKSELLT